MKKLLISCSCLFLLSACGTEEPKKDEGTKNTEQTEQTQSKSEPVDSKQIKERITKGMNLDTYSAEITAMEEKGKTSVIDKYVLSDNKQAFANILQVSDGFVAVKTDGKEITGVESFPSIEDAESHLKDNNFEKSNG